MRRRVVAALGVLALLLAAGWFFYKGEVYSSHGATLIVQRKPLPLPGGGGGPARPVTITDTPGGCLGVDGVPAAWPPGTTLSYASGALTLRFEGKAYKVGDSIDINGLRKPKPRASYTLWVPGIPHTCGASVIDISDGFSAAG